MASDFPALPDTRNITSERAAQDALGSLLEAVTETNRILLAESSCDIGPRSSVSGRMGDLPGKLKKWLAKLLEKVKEIVAKITDVVSFSITVGTTVSVTVNFAKP
jgi:hypothetical protein